MTCGIYKLSFNGTDKVYIGQSENIEERYYKHLWNLKNNKSSKKLQEAFKLYGLPLLEILTDCSKSELNELENMAISLYNSYINGLNGVETAESMPTYFGENNGNAKYTKEQYLQVATLLCDAKHTAKYISKTTGVSEFVIKHISKGENNSWIKEEYPEIWNKISLLKGNRKSTTNSAKSMGIVYPPIVSPDGKIYTVDNINAFAREHSLAASALYNVLKSIRKTHKGWKLAQK
jgi:group I intron endonuclease